VVKPDRGQPDPSGEPAHQSAGVRRQASSRVRAVPSGRDDLDRVYHSHGHPRPVRGARLSPGYGV